MEFKQFVLLPVMDATAPIHQQLPEGKRARITKIPRHRPFLQVSFIDKDGKSRTIRYKSSSDKIYQDEQIKDGILANTKFTSNEYNDLVFKHGSLVTNKPNAIAFLLSHPECEGFEGICDDVKFPKYQVVDRGKENKVTNEDLRRRAKAATKILDLDLKQAQEMLIRLNGSFFETPKDVIECQNLLIDFLDNSEDAGVDAILKEDKTVTVDEKTTVLIGSLINAGRLSFNEIEGSISKKDRDGKWISIREMSTTYSLEERTRLFSDFLNTEDGKPLRTDLENDLKEVETLSAAKQD